MSFPGSPAAAPAQPPAACAEGPLACASINRPESSESAGVTASYDVDKDASPSLAPEEETLLVDLPPPKRRKLGPASSTASTATPTTPSLPCFATSAECPPPRGASEDRGTAALAPPAPPRAPSASMSPHLPAPASMPRELRDLMNRTYEQTSGLCNSEGLNLPRQQFALRLTMFYMWRFFMGYTNPDRPQLSNQPRCYRQFDRKVMMCACLFLAAKNTNSLVFSLGKLVRQAWQHEPGTAAYDSRQQQIVKAELYLVSAVLQFDFTHLSKDYLVHEMKHLCKMGAKELLGTKAELSWTIPAWQGFKEVYRTPLIVRFTLHELAAGWLWLFLDFCKAAHVDPWVTVSGVALKNVDAERWLKNLRNLPARAGRAFRIDEVRQELEREMALISITPESVLSRITHNYQKLKTSRQRSMSLALANGDEPRREPGTPPPPPP